MIPAKKISFLQTSLLSWYEKHQRTLPWRAKDDKPNPYYVWLSEIMLQQTTVPTVIPYFNRFIKKWPTVDQLANATEDEVFHLWQGLGYYQRARNLLKCAQEVTHSYHRKFPEDLKTLLSLPGVGPYTAAAIRTIAFNKYAVVVDGNVERVLSRYLCFEGLFPGAKNEFSHKISPLYRVDKPGNLAQAIMDIGSSICKPISPKCAICPLHEKCCSFSTKTVHNYPKKAQKPLKPTRFGTVYWIKNAKNQLYIRKRTEGRLLAGLMEFPSTDWLEVKDGIKDKNQAKVHHTFTHFHLILDIVSTTKVPSNIKGGFWCDMEDLKKHAFPTVMQKVIKAASKISH